MPSPATSDQRPATKFIFIGVTTAQSSSMHTFPKWMEVLGRPEVEIEGMDFRPGDDPARYRAAVERIKQDPQMLGGLVTTHKIDLLEAARDLFDGLGPYATQLGEISSISKRDGRLLGHAPDPIAGGRSLNAIIGDGYFGRTGAEVLFLGAGGAATALTVYLVNRPDPADRPRRITLVDLAPERLERVRRLVGEVETGIAFAYEQNGEALRNDELMTILHEGSVVVNATGMGKDRPGSPITDDGRFPKNGVAWELNYRGERRFLHQAHAQAEPRNLRVEDGWVYFLHGWTSVISQVLDVEIDEAMLKRLAATSPGPS